jgi:flavodoxin
MAQNGNNIKDRLPEKTLLVVFSYHHMNTEKVAGAFAKVLDAKIKTPQQADPEELNDYDLIGFGSGIDSDKHYKQLLDFADALPRVADKKAFIFSTNGAPASLFSESMSSDQMEKNHRLIRKKLRAKGYAIVGEFSCPGFNTNLFLKHLGGLNRGRPNGEDLNRAVEFALGLKQKMRE